MDILQRLLTVAPPPADVRIPYGDGPCHFGDLRLPKGPGPHPVIAAYHGGWWRSEFDLVHFGHLASDLTARGYATWNVEFRRVGHEGGGWPGTFQDIVRGLEVLASLAPQYGLDLNRVLLFGHSAGAHLALWLGSRHGLPPEHPLRGTMNVRWRGVVALAGIIDLKKAHAIRIGAGRPRGDGALERFVGGPPDQVPDRYIHGCPRGLLPSRTRVVIVHGDADDVVPISISQSYYSAAREAGDDVRLEVLPDTGHFELIDPQSQAWKTVTRAIDELMR